MDTSRNEKKISVEEGKDLIKKVHENIFKYYEFIKDIEPANKILNELVTKLEIIDSLNEEKISIHDNTDSVYFVCSDLSFSEGIFYELDDLVYDTFGVEFRFNENKVVIDIKLSNDTKYDGTTDIYGDDNYVQRTEKMKFIFEEKEDKIKCDYDRSCHIFSTNGKSSGGTTTNIENKIIVLDKPEDFKNMMDFSGNIKTK